MAYQIDRYNNTVLTIVEDGTVDQSTDLKFIGKNYAGYGEIQNENFLYLLENFAGANEPPRALSGQIWFDSANSKLKFYDGSQWRTTGGSAVGTTEPTGLTSGDFWWDSANDQLYVYNGTNFVLIGPQNAGEGVTQMVSLEVLDSVGGTRSVIAATIEDEPIIIVSPQEFTLSTAWQTSLPGFDLIKKGVTLVNTKAATAGITSTDHYFWGTASASLGLVNTTTGAIVSAENVVTTTPGEAISFADSTEPVTFADTGLSVGAGFDFNMYVENDTDAVIENQSGIDSEILFKVTDGTGTIIHTMTINKNGLIPAVDNTFDIGTSSLRWANVYGVNFVGEATKATSLRVGSDFRTAAVNATNNTVAVRDATGNIAANLFQGTATAARYADLAEKYATDQNYPVGTVIAVGGSAETRAAKLGDIAIGVVSENPALMMNSEAEGQYVGLKGRVPIRVVGPVSKGQPVYVADDGVASTIASNSLVGVALETNHADDEKLVECVLKV